MSRQKSVKKRGQILKDVKRKLTKQEEMNLCNCLHTRKGDVDIVPINNGDGLTYRCRICGKVIKANKINKETRVSTNPNDASDKKVQVGYDDVINKIDSMCDVIKMNLNEETRKDEKMADQLAEFQFRARNQIVPLYEACLKKTGQKQKQSGPRTFFASGR